MSVVLAVAFTACTFASCNTYDIDTATSSRDCNDNLVLHSENFGNRWAVRQDSMVPLQKWLDKFHVGEKAEQITDYDFTCEPIHLDDIP